MPTVFIADDHEIVRRGLRALLAADPSFTVVGEAENGLDTLERVGELTPDVLVVDVMMPDLNGLEVVRQVKNRAPQTRVVVLSLYENEPYVLEALRNGAAAYLIKSASTEYILQALREVMLGHLYLSPPLSDRAINAYLVRSGESGDVLDPYDMLTTREREVLQLSAEGSTNAQIAERLSISPRTAETHRTNLMRKLGLKGQADLLKYALRRGIISD